MSKAPLILRVLITGTIVSVAVFLGCAVHAVRPLPPDVLVKVDAFVSRFADQPTLLPDEQAACRVAFADFSEFLVRRNGAARFREFAGRVNQPADLYSALSETYRINPVWLFTEYNRPRFTSETAALGEWQMDSTDHFIFVYRQGSGAERDLSVIMREVESTLVCACRTLGFSPDSLEGKLDSLKEMRDSVASLYYVKGGNRTWTGGRIPLVFVEDRREYHKLGGSKYSSGQYNHGYGDGGYTGRIVFLYRDVLGLLALDHEIAHAVYFTAPAAPVPVWRAYCQAKVDSGITRWTYTPWSFYLLNGVNADVCVIEGVATWCMIQHGLVPKVCGFPNLRRFAADMTREGVRPSFKKLSDWNISLNLFEKALTLLGDTRYVGREMLLLYLGSASLIDYLHDRYGTEKLHELITAPPSDERMMEIYGMSQDVMERDWQRWIAGGAE